MRTYKLGSHGWHIHDDPTGWHWTVWVERGGLVGTAVSLDAARAQVLRAYGELVGPGSVVEVEGELP